MRTLALPFLAATLVASPHLLAQDLTVHSTSDVHFYGALGKVISFASRFGGGDKEDNKNTTTYIAGHRLRTDNGSSATIIDLDAGRITSIDNKAKSYYSLTFAEMAQMAKQMEDSMRVAMQRAKAQPKQPDQKGDVKIDYQVAVDRPGEKADIAGSPAERLFMTITMKADVTPEGEPTQEAGKMVFFVDEWIAKDAPQVAAMKEFTKAYADKVGSAFRQEARGTQQAFAFNPQLKQGFEAAAKERAKVPGVPMRSTTYVVFVPANMEFDRNLALNATPVAAPTTEEKKGGLRGMMRSIKKAAEEADKNGEGRTQQPKQGTMMSVTTEVQSVDKGRIDPAMFAPPAGYKEMKPQMMGR